MSDAEHPTRRRQVRWFVALHLGAVGGMYALALSVGGGYAMPPFPVNERTQWRPVTAATAATVAPRPEPPSPDSGERIHLPQTADLAAPWSYGSDGRARVHER
jgi:hypothetical protein